MPQRRAVTRDHLLPLIRLPVRDDQREPVAQNVMTFAQVPYDPGSCVWGLRDDETPVGLMAMVNPHEYPYRDEGDDTGAACLWRLMIDAAHQRKGCRCDGRRDGARPGLPSPDPWRQRYKPSREGNLR